MTEDEMVGWPHRLHAHEFERLNAHEFAQTLRDDEGQGSLVCAAVRGVAKGRTQVSN